MLKSITSLKLAKFTVSFVKNSLSRNIVTLSCIKNDKIETPFVPLIGDNLPMENLDELMMIALTLAADSREHGDWLDCIPETDEDIVINGNRYNDHAYQDCEFPSRTF